MTVWLNVARKGPRALAELTKPQSSQPDRDVLSVKSVLSYEGHPTTADIFDLWEERAAIREYDGGQSRESAERDAAKRLGVPLSEVRAKSRRSKP